MGQRGPANAEYKRARVGKNHTKEIKWHRSVKTCMGRSTQVTGDGMTCGPREREALVPDKRSGNGSASMVFGHRRHRRRRRVDVSAPIRRIWCAASGYMIHWTC